MYTLANAKAVIALNEGELQQARDAMHLCKQLCAQKLVILSRNSAKLMTDDTEGLNDYIGDVKITQKALSFVNKLLNDLAAIE